MLNLFDSPMKIILFIIVTMVIIVYINKDLIPKTKRLHKLNINKAKKILIKVKQVGVEKPEFALGILRKIDPFVFEELLLLAFKNQLFKIKRNLRYTGDNGFDGVVFDKSGKKFLIQAKRYSSSITPSHVNDFASVINMQKAHGGFFIHTGRTGKKSYLNCANNIYIISGQRLINLIRGDDFYGNVN